MVHTGVCSELPTIIDSSVKFSIALHSYKILKMGGLEIKVHRLEALVGSFCPNPLGLEGQSCESRFDSSNLTGSIAFCSVGEDTRKEEGIVPTVKVSDQACMYKTSVYLSMVALYFLAEKR